MLTGGTDVHLVLCDLRESELDGKQAEDRLHAIGITVNRNAVPFDPRPPVVTSGLRIGTPALATRGLQVDGLRRDRRDHRRDAARRGLRGPARRELSERTAAIADRYPLYAGLGAVRGRLRLTACRPGGAECGESITRCWRQAALRVDSRR